MWWQIIVSYRNHNFKTQMEDTPKLFNIEKVRKLTKLWNKTQEFTRCLNNLGEPLLYDYSLLERMYNTYLKVFESRGKAEQAFRVYNRQKFLIIVLYIYSPKTLAGDRMRIGLRDKLSKLFGLNTSTPISDNCSNLIFNYDKYRDFRRDVEIIFNAIIAELGTDFVWPED